MEQNPIQRRRLRIGNAADITDGKGREVFVEGRHLALFKTNGGFYAVSNQCLHRGGPLSEGELDGFKVTCPWHGWKYDVRTGAFDIIPTLKVKSFPVLEENGALYIEID